MKRMLRIRTIKHLSQSELANRIGISRAQLARIEELKVDPRLSTVRKIAKGLNVSTCCLIGDDEIDNNIV